MLRVTGLIAFLATAVATAPQAAARPPFPYEAHVRVWAERSELANDDHDLVATTLGATADLMRAGPASLILELSGSDIVDDRVGVVPDVWLAAATMGLDLNFGRRHGDFGVEIIYRMMLLWADAAGLDARVTPYPFAFGGLRVGVGWRWLELGGTPWPRPGEARVAHIGYGMDLFHWVFSLGVGLFGGATLDANGDLEQAAPELGAYGEITGRFDCLRLGVRAALGGYSALTLVVGWQADLL